MWACQWTIEKSLLKYHCDCSDDDENQAEDLRRESRRLSLPPRHIYPEDEIEEEDEELAEFPAAC